MGDDTGANMPPWGALYGGCGAPAPAPAVAAAAAGGSASSPTGAQPGGRVGKPPARRRSRASRRAPVTLLNTDTANFRAMVQQLTGVPPGPCGEYGAPLVRPSPTSVVAPFGNRQLAAAAARHPHRPTSLQSQLFMPQPQAQPQYYGYGGEDGMAPFLHGGFESSAEDRLLLQSMMQAAETTVPTARPASANSGSGAYSLG